MKLYYWNWRRNFGDELSKFLLSRKVPHLLVEQRPVLLLGIGTLLNTKVPSEPTTKVVFSSGCGYGSKPVIDDCWHFYCVRGPLTAKALGLSLKTAVTDGGVLIREYFEREQDHRQDLIGFVPHWSHMTERLGGLLRDEGVLPIDPMRSPQEVIRDISSVDVLITESLHGAVVADSLRIPWVPVTLSSSILDFKWIDWCTTVGLDYSPTCFRSALPSGRLGQVRSIPFVVQLRRLRRRMKPVLSQESVVVDLCEQLNECLASLERDWRVEH